MPTLTLHNVPENLLDRIRELADIERRSINQQALVLLDRALDESLQTFGTAYRRFRAHHDPSPLRDRDFRGLRSADTGR